MNGNRVVFYSVEGLRRQGRRFVAAAAFATLAGCGQISFPLTSTSDSAPPLQPIGMTGSIASVNETTAERDVVSTDRGIIATALAAAPSSSETPTQLAWVNPETGNQGTIFEVVDSDPKGNGGCRKFSTTANTIEGVRAYSGVACPDSFRKWHVTVLKPADAGA